MASRKRAKTGDVLEYEVGNDVAYLHYTGKHPEYGDAVFVGPRLGQRQRKVKNEIFSDSYLVFYPVNAAISQGLAKIVANIAPPGMPERLRRPGARTGRRVDTWIIEDSSDEVVKTKLSEEELRLPIATIWNHEMLLRRVAEGWDPSQEGRGS